MKILSKGFIPLFCGGLLCIPFFAMAGGEIVERVRKALEYLNSNECSIEENQKLNYLCKATTDIDLNELVNSAKKAIPCIKIADDFSSLTTSSNKKSYTVNINLQSLLCGSSDAFSVTPSDGCLTDEDFENIKGTAEDIINQLVNIITNSLDTKKLFDIRPTCMKWWNLPFAPENPFTKLKSDIMNSLIHMPRCDNECEGGKDKDGNVTEECCKRNNGIFITKGNRNYCCPDKSENPNCPSKQPEPSNECVSSCRIGTEDINGDCCEKNKISNAPDGKECCKGNTRPSVYDEKRSLSICCKKGMVAISDKECCLEENVVETGENGEKICCPAERVAYAEDAFQSKKICCKEDEVPAKGYEFGFPLCCNPENVVIEQSGEKWCCIGTRHKTNEHCCRIGDHWID